MRRKLESTAQIAQLEKTKGKDGKERPARKPKAAVTQRVFDSPQQAHAPKAAPKAISKREMTALSDSWLEVYKHIKAGNNRSLKDALKIHREKIDRILEGLSS